MNIELDGKEIHFISWNYPEIYDTNKQSIIQLNLCHTRASDGIRIKYDSERDCYIIEQPIDDSIDTKWKETAFVQSWQLREENDQKK